MTEKELNVSKLYIDNNNNPKNFKEFQIDLMRFLEYYMDIHHKKKFFKINVKKFIIKIHDIFNNYNINYLLTLEKYIFIYVRML
jgi:hypothetical protein